MTVVLSLQLFTFASCGIAFVYSMKCFVIVVASAVYLSLIILFFVLFCFHFVISSVSVCIFRHFATVFCRPKEIVKNQLPDLFLKTFSEH